MLVMTTCQDFEEDEKTNSRFLISLLDQVADCHVVVCSSRESSIIRREIGLAKTSVNHNFE